MSVGCSLTKLCACQRREHECKLIVLTGGPGAGKTAVLEIAKKNFCEHVSVLPEAASIIFGGGFWRHETLATKKASQRAIFHVQRELERAVDEEKRSAIALCDRGTIDGLAYWPDTEESFWKELGTTREKEFSRYAAVIHLRSPSESMGYNFQNPVRTESAHLAAIIDDRIAKAWEGHPRRFFIDSTEDFFKKAERAVALIKSELPDCCKLHQVKETK